MQLYFFIEIMYIYGIEFNLSDLIMNEICTQKSK